ncbi:hypothetical protein DQG23_10800 [Paenibacillus contaminans]|uniref:HTH araC/xylS-type domain-containing protein n=2 Tax=Paenibacillus contaminans TaxID=450362 RepID=A0A329MT53_9BACL|nr:hypothetical protein DQG23_10800 [Paenibacillus contaminans]
MSMPERMMPEIMNGRGSTVANAYLERRFDTFPVHLQLDTLRSHSRSMHTQRGIEINLSLEGDAYYVVGTRVYRQMPGQLMLVPGHLPHQIYVDPSCSYRRAALCIDGEGRSRAMPQWLPLLLQFPRLSVSGCSQMTLPPEKMHAIQASLTSIYDEMNRQHEAGWQQMVVSHAIQLLVLIERSFQAGSESAPVGITAPAGQGFDPAAILDPIEACCQYIHGHLKEDLTLQKIADRFHFSPEHLTRRFKRNKGISLYQYVLRQRVLESKRMLLHEPGMTMTDIAYAVGFGSSQQFSRVFKSVLRTSPSDFRRTGHDGQDKSIPCRTNKA